MQTNEMPTRQIMRTSDDRVILTCEIIMWTSDNCDESNVLFGLDTRYHITGYEEVDGPCGPDVLPVGKRFVFVMCGDCYSGLLELARKVASDRGITMDAALRLMAASAYRGAVSDRWRFDHYSQEWLRYPKGWKLQRNRPNSRGRRLS